MKRKTPLEFVKPTRKVQLNAIPDLAARTREVQDLIGERAHTLYGYGQRRAQDDLEAWLKDWVRAESEVLCPVEVSIRETATALRVDLTTPGFSASELQLSIDPQCFAISGTKASNSSDGKQVQAQLFRVSSLPAVIEPSGMVVSVNGETLTLALPKTRQNDSAKPPMPIRPRRIGNFEASALHALVLLT
jgi:HSP20 family molecular chaperone IbpA